MFSDFVIQCYDVQIKSVINTRINILLLLPSAKILKIILHWKYKTNHTLFHSTSTFLLLLVKTEENI